MFASDRFRCFVRLVQLGWNLCSILFILLFLDLIFKFCIGV